MIELVFLAATVYSGYAGQPLYCDQGDGLVYDEDAAPWVALPAGQCGQTWECGDLIYLAGFDANGEPWSLMARALDAGPLDGYCVRMEGACVPIGVDIPAPFAPFPGTSARIERMIDITAQAQGR